MDVDSVDLISTCGTIAKIPKLQYDRLAAGGRFVLEFVPPAPPVASAEWITVTEAAQRLADDLGASPKVAAVKVTRAATKGEFVAEGRDRERRIDPASFALWCDAQRRRQSRREAEAESEDRIDRKRRELHIDDD